jgi:hypothetical protein
VSSHSSFELNAAAVLWIMATVIWLLAGCVLSCWARVQTSKTAQPEVSLEVQTVQPPNGIVAIKHLDAELD